MKSNIGIGDSIISVEHQLDRYSTTEIEGLLVVSSEDKESNCLSVIEVQEKDFKRDVFVHWTNEGDWCYFSVLYVSETKTLFVVAGYVVASIDLDFKEVKELNFPMLFWAFERKGNYVLELGELECRLYDLNGSLIDSTSVDPPYEFEEKINGIYFQSPVMGTTWLHYEKKKISTSRFRQCRLRVIA